jgi:succinyl-CoA synthetase beta subunit
VRDRDEAVSAADELGYPVVLKTAEPGIHHKSDRGGVHLDLQDRAAVAAAYEWLASHIGGRAIVAPMVQRATELAFGAVIDPQFGPLVMVGMGGTLIEVLADTAVALAPFDEHEAHRLLSQLSGRPLLEGARGMPKADVCAVARALAQFATLVAALADELESVDVNPVIAGPTGVVAVDALVVAKRGTRRRKRNRRPK